MIKNDNMEDVQVYARECGKLSKKYDVPFDVVLSIGPKHMEAFVKCVERIKRTKSFGSFYSKQTIIEYLEDCPPRVSGLNDIICDALGVTDLFGRNLYDHIQEFGIVGRQRVGDYLLSVLKPVIEEDK